MFIPIGTDNPLRKSPTANYVLIFLNFAIFFMTHLPHVNALGQYSTIRDTAVPFELNPGGLMLHQFITYAFLHAGWMHILGNMLFLYIFGNNVNDRLGHLGYVLLYLGGGVFSGLGHSLVSSSPVLGASGAVATITGAYMVLFPKTYINVLYWLFFIGTIEVPAMYFILFKLIIFDNVISPRLEAGMPNIAYSAHLAGYLYGIAIPMALLIFKLLPHSHFDLWALLKRWRRRQEFKAAAADSYGPYRGVPGKRRVEAKVWTSASGMSEEELQNRRAAISEALSQTHLSRAAELYVELLSLEPHQTLPMQQQLDIANKLTQDENYEQAAQSYELFVNAYPNYPRMEQVHLMLGWIYSRYLLQKELGLKYLRLAAEKLTDKNQTDMCRSEIERLELS